MEAMLTISLILFFISREANVSNIFGVGSMAFCEIGCFKKRMLGRFAVINAS